jgi:hypothetical protein
MVGCLFTKHNCDAMSQVDLINTDFIILRTAGLIYDIFWGCYNHLISFFVTITRGIIIHFEALWTSVVPTASRRDVNYGQVRVARWLGLQH